MWNSSYLTQKELDKIEQHALSREHLRGKRTRLYCPQESCKTLRLVVDVLPLAKEQKLECGHTRRP